MITRFYVDNYKCLVNFEYKPQPLELIIGANGSGKSTVFEALDKVRRFLAGENIDDVFETSDRTVWNDKYDTTFELDAVSGADEISYRLNLHISHYGIWPTEEDLTINGKKLLETRYEQNATFTSDSVEGYVPFLWLAYVPPGSKPTNLPEDYTSMNLFQVKKWKERLESVFFCRLNPPLMSSAIGKAISRPQIDLSDFASFYLFLLQQKQGKIFEMFPYLRDVINGFDSFAIQEDFEKGRRELQVLFNQPRKDLRLLFDQLSDGQRALIVLYTLLFGVLEENTTLVIDEPENYISLAELQPLIVLMEERIREHGGQILLISHSPEFINMLTDQGRCTRFYRENNGHTRLEAFQPDSELTAAEIVARGWEDDE